MAVPNVRRFAVPVICLTGICIAYSSQYLFYFLQPGPLTRNESLVFNALACAAWWSYERTCRVDPGRLPRKLRSLEEDSIAAKSVNGSQNIESASKLARRWCKKCKAVKPPRSHHCRQCERCIPKMDHHCPWTSNCVSHTTFPHFLRFVFYTCVSLATLDYFLITRAYGLYEQRNLPSYLGPSIYALAHLMVLLLITNLILFALIILLVTATNSLLLNTTMIEHWEIERHEALLDRSRRLGGYVYGPGGVRVRIQKQEFPYDIGMWNNAVQGMGTSNIITWFLPFGGGPSMESGWDFETNGFEEPGTEWPPIDPDKLPRVPIGAHQDTRNIAYGKPDEEIEAFKKRQQADYKRWKMPEGQPIRQREIARAYEVGQESEGDYEDSSEYESEQEEGMDGEPGWTSSDGSRLRDFGVDEEADVIEIEDEDDIPLGELIRRRKGIIQNKED